MKTVIKEGAKKILASPSLLPLTKIFSPIYSGIGSIVMFHRIVEQINHNSCEDLEVTDKYLEEVINYFLSNNYEVVSLDTFYEILNKRYKINKKVVVFTFDDGYIDNYTIAYPIFKKHNLPFTIYITTSFPDKTAKLWWYALKDLIETNTILKFYHKEQYHCYDIKNRHEKHRVYLKIRRYILSLSRDEHNELFVNLFEKNDIDIAEYTKKLTLNWDQIRILSNDKLVTIGAHTINHYNLRELDTDSAKKEMMESKNRIEMLTQNKVEHFAYPFGSKHEASIREFELAKRVGFKTVTTTRCGNIFENHKDYTNSLPRISLNPSAESPFPNYYVNGLIPAIKNNFKRVITD